MKLKAGALGILALAFFALIGFFIDAHPHHQLARALEPPSVAYWLGTDAFGVSLALRLMRGAAQTLFLGMIVAIVTLALGTGIATLSVFVKNHWVELFLVRLIDSVLAFPGLLSALLLATLLPRSIGSVVFLLVLTGWPARARFVRNQLLALKTAPFVESAIAAGANRMRLLTRHFWPHLRGQLVQQAALGMGYAITAEAALSFLGLSENAQNPSWGKLIAEGRVYLIEAPHLSIFPGLAFVGTLLSIHLFVEGWRKRLDPIDESGLY